MPRWLLLIAAACGSTPPPPHRNEPPPVARADELCCCAAQGQPWESRVAACAAGTPMLPAGRCVDWTTCGFPHDTHRTLADRPDLALPPGCADEWCEGKPAPQVAHTPGAGRCVQIADHFEPWRSNKLWAAEISPRDRLISDCRAQHWSRELEDCLLAANSPLDLDGCVGVQ